VSTLAHWLRAGVELLLYPFDLLSRFWGLTAIAVLTALVMVLIVGRATPQERIRRARARISGAIYEIRLFLDSPLRVFSAQGALLRYSLYYVALLLPAFVVMAPLLGLLYLHLEVRYGLEPLEPGEQTVVGVTVDPEVDGYAVVPGDLPEGLAVTAPPVFVEAEHRVFLRVDVLAPGIHSLPIRAGESEVSKEIVAGGAVEVSPERNRGAAALWAFGDEPPLPSGGPIRAISVAYPDAEQSWLGLPIPWWLYWLVIATIAALLLARPLHIAV